jgi:choline/glycine/proline betaine transport protein
MLFSGMGIIVVLSISEPIYHFLSPPMAEGGTAQLRSYEITFLHWGFHAGQCMHW